MKKMREFFTPDSRSKSPVFSPTENMKRGDNTKTGSPRRSRSRKAGKEEAKRRWKLVRNICIAFRIGRRRKTKVFSLGSKFPEIEEFSTVVLCGMDVFDLWPE